MWPTPSPRLQLVVCAECPETRPTHPPAYQAGSVNDRIIAPPGVDLAPALGDDNSSTVEHSSRSGTTEWRAAGSPRQYFRPYERAPAALGQPGSVGLGLTISRTLARLMNGDLTYEHTGGWSTFRLSLSTGS